MPKNDIVYIQMNSLNIATPSMSAKLSSNGLCYMYKKGKKSINIRNEYGIYFMELN